MAGPITWQNIAAPNFSDAFRGMAQAQQGMDGAFTGLEDIIKKREATDTANWNQGKTNNTNEMLNGVLDPKTPEEFAAKEAVLRQQLSGFGAQVDATAVRSALDGRLGTLQQRSVANQQYTDQQTEVGQRDQVAIFRSALLNAKTKEESDAIMLGAQGAFGNGVLSPTAATDLMERGVARGQNIVGQDRATTKFGFDVAQEADRVKMAPLDRAAKQASINASNAQAEHARAQASTVKNPKMDPMVKEATIKALLADTPLAGGTMDTKEGQDSFYAAMKAMGIAAGSTQERDILKQFSDKFGGGIEIGTDDAGKPIKVGMPVTVAIDELRKSDENLLAMAVPGWSRMGDVFRNRLEARIKDDPELMSGIQAGMAIKGLRFNALKSKGTAVPDARGSESSLDAALAASKKKARNLEY